MRLKSTHHLYVRSMRKLLKVTAIFTDDDAANAYMATHRDEGVVAVMGEFILVANLHDHGNVAAGEGIGMSDAAAADLLKVVKAFLRAPSDGSRNPGESTRIIQDFHLRDARAAVDKAEGRA